MQYKIINGNIRNLSYMEEKGAQLVWTLLSYWNQKAYYKGKGLLVRWEYYCKFVKKWFQREYKRQGLMIFMAKCGEEEVYKGDNF